MINDSRMTLDDTKCAQVCAMLSIGATRELAAEQVGVNPSTIYRTALGDPEFAENLRRAESMHELLILKCLNETAKDPKNWRVGVWILEHRYPNHWALSDPEVYSEREISHLLCQVRDLILEEVHDDTAQLRVITHMQELAVALHAYLLKSKTEKRRDDQSHTQPA
jgi:hypothetical protein